MGKVYAEIDAGLRAFIDAQHMFFTATAPLAVGGHINLSPKGLDSLRVLGPRSVAYLDQVGSGAETIAHLRENGRIVIMFCAFADSPRIVRLHGRGVCIEPQQPSFAALRAHFPAGVPGRAVIQVEVTRISDSCGWGVPLLSYTGERELLEDWAVKKGPDGTAAYQREKNASSIDGLPALTWVSPAAPAGDEVR